MDNRITDNDTPETLTVKLAARDLVLMRLVKRGLYWHALGSRTDTLRPATAYARCPAVAVRRMAACLDPTNA